jgi:hypothetical protein
VKWAFDLLELPMDADAASIKRAYARLLRTKRPDEDPEAFQQLHVAYKTALAHANALAVTAPQRQENRVVLVKPEHKAPAAPAATVSPATTNPVPPVLSSTSSVTIPLVNIPALADEVIRAAAETDDGKAILQWLQARPEFWSITTKQQAGQVVVHRMFQTPQAMSSNSLDALLRFFDLDHVLSGINPLTLQQLRRRQVALWRLIPSNHHDLVRQIQLASGASPGLERVRRNLTLLQQPLRWYKVMWNAIQTGHVRDIGHLLRVILGNDRIEELPASIDRQHAYFWVRASATGGPITAPRLVIGAWRAGLAALAGSLLTFALFSLSLTSQVSGPASSDQWEGAVATSAGVAVSIFVLWLIYVGCIWFDQWQGLPEFAPSKRPWLRRLAIPALCGFGFGLYEMNAPYTLTAPIVFASFVLAVRRFRRRSPRPANKAKPRIGSMMPAMIFIGIAAANALSSLHENSNFNFPFLPAAAFATLSIWLVDMWRHRSHVHPKLARS